MKRTITLILFTSFFVIGFAMFFKTNIVDFEKGVVYVNGVQLKYKKTIVINTNYAKSEKFTCKIGAGDVSTQGVDNDNLKVTVTYYEYKPDDAKVFIKNSSLGYKTKSGKEICIQNVEILLPNGKSFYVSSGSGDVFIKKVKNSNEVKLSTGSGDIKMSEVQNLNNLSLLSGSGDISSEKVTNIQRMRALTGSGTIAFSNCRGMDDLLAKSGSGDIELNDINAKIINSSSGSGDMNVTHSLIDELKFTSGSGEFNAVNSTIKKKQIKTN